MVNLLCGFWIYFGLESFLEIASLGLFPSVFPTVPLQEVLQNSICAFLKVFVRLSKAHSFGFNKEDSFIYFDVLK